MQKTIIRRHVEPAHIHTTFHPILQRIYAARGIQHVHEVDYGLEQLLPFQTLRGLDQAVACIANALEEQQNILIVGDFDADGATSTAVAIRALRSFGAKHVDYLVPNRFAFGYGLTPELVQVAKKTNPALIVTVDNGIANHAGVIAAKELGMQVIVTDHHLAANTLPPADAIVNPNQPDDQFPSKCIAGVGVIFYVMLALRRYLIANDWFSKNKLPEPNMSRLLDLVALGTVADVVPLDHNNRLFVQQGLRRIRAGQCVAGITALLEVGGRDPARIVASDLGFIVGPRLNAAGRLDDMSLGIECLLCDDLARAKTMAAHLSQLNDERKVIEHDMQEQALAALKKIQVNEKSLPLGVCLFDEEWHQGVIGIVASRIKDRFHRPVIAFAPVNDAEIKGSARSIQGVHIRDVLATIATEHPTLINKFGGHAMAAGLTLARTVFQDFAKLFAEGVAKCLREEDLQQALLSDGELMPADMTLEIADLVREAGPWGQAFPEPLFDGVFAIIEQRLVGGKHLKVVLSKDGTLFDGIAFNIDLQQWPNYRCDYAKIVYRLDVNEYRGKRKVQLIIEHIEHA